MARTRVFFLCTAWFFVAGQFNRVLQAFQTFILHFYQEDHDPISSSLTILGLVHPILLNFLQLKYVAKNQVDPFQSHPRTMRVAVTSLLLYCMLVGIHHKFSSHNYYRNYADVFHHAKMLFSGLSLVLTASLLFADEIRPILCAVCVLFCIGEWAYRVLKKMMQRIGERTGAGGNFHCLFSGLTSVRSGSPLLPV